jgi:hypothetical protein
VIHERRVRRTREGTPMPERDIPVRITRPRDQGHGQDLANTTAAERIGMMWQLALDAWSF